MGLKKLLLATALCLFLLASLISASQISTQRSCQFESDCGTWETCLNHNCIAKEGFCNYDYECESGNCIYETHSCRELGAEENSLDVLIVLDASDSMYSGNKLTEAKKAAITAVDSFEDGTDFAITYLGVPGNCQISEVSEFTTNKGQIKYQINKIEGRSNTALGYSLRRAYGIMAVRAQTGSAEKQYIIVFSDGLETCGEDPCEIVKEWRKSNRTIPTYTIAHTISEESRVQLQCIATVSEGEYYEAPTNESIKEAFADAVDDIKQARNIEAGTACPAFCQGSTRYRNGTYNEELKTCSYWVDVCEFGCTNGRCVILTAPCNTAECVSLCTSETNLSMENCTVVCTYSDCIFMGVQGTTECGRDRKCVDNCWAYPGRIVDLNLIFNDPWLGVTNGVSNIGKTIGCPVVGASKHLANDFEGGVEAVKYGANGGVWVITHPIEIAGEGINVVYKTAEHEFWWCLGSGHGDCVKKYSYRMQLDAVKISADVSERVLDAIVDTAYEETIGAVVDGDWGRPIAFGIETWGATKAVGLGGTGLKYGADTLEKLKFPVKISTSAPSGLKEIIPYVDEGFVVATRVLGDLNETVN
ncbi:MAG: vWA domain-containing protein [Candidatus Micrarchaeota archaeon]